MYIHFIIMDSHRIRTLNDILHTQQPFKNVECRVQSVALMPKCLTASNKQ